MTDKVRVMLDDGTVVYATPAPMTDEEVRKSRWYAYNVLADAIVADGGESRTLRLFITHGLAILDLEHMGEALDGMSWKGNPRDVNESQADKMNKLTDLIKEEWR